MPKLYITDNEGDEHEVYGHDCYTKEQCDAYSEMLNECGVKYRWENV